MAILRIVANPADVGVGGYNWYTTTGNNRFNSERVEGAFEFPNQTTLSVPHPVGAAEVWYHFRYAHVWTNSSLGNATVFEVRDANSNIIATMSTVASQSLRTSAVGVTTANSGSQAISAGTAYSIDVQVIVNTTITVRWYINGALYADLSVLNNTGTIRGVPASVTMRSNDQYITTYFSEIIIANEDTRGMRVREMRPKAFGIFQEWDGVIANLRDNDLATGISVDEANRRVSFGITNVENVAPGDVINRVVAQTFAQRGESGLSQFNHFFRHRDGTVTDGAAQNLSVLGNFFVEEFPINPKTGLAWQPEDFRSLQSGIRSRA